MNTNPAPDQVLVCSMSVERRREGPSLYFGSWQGGRIAGGSRLDPNHPRGAGVGARASFRGWLKRPVARAVFFSSQPSRRREVDV